MNNKISAFVFAALLFTGCSLEEKPYGFYSDKNFYTTEADAESSTLFIYDAINYIEYSRAIVFPRYPERSATRTANPLPALRYSSPVRTSMRSVARMAPGPLTAWLPMRHSR